MRDVLLKFCFRRKLERQLLASARRRTNAMCSTSGAKTEQAAELSATVRQATKAKLLDQNP
jgi:hypothetical protein